jgi:hypothetical protein
MASCGKLQAQNCWSATVVCTRVISMRLRHHGAVHRCLYANHILHWYLVISHDMDLHSACLQRDGHTLPQC